MHVGAVELFITGTTRITKTYYALGSQPVARRVVSATTNTVYWLHGDALGSLVLVTAGAGPGTAQRYTPYGTLRVGGGLPTDLGFTGQRADGTGLMFYQARYYSPYLNRWIQPDSIIPELGNSQALNRYSYVYNNPLKYTDPTGHRACLDSECKFVALPGRGKREVVQQRSIMSPGNLYPRGTTGLTYSQLNSLDQKVIEAAGVSPRDWDNENRGGLRDVGGTLADPAVWLVGMFTVAKLAPVIGEGATYVAGLCSADSSCAERAEPAVRLYRAVSQAEFKDIAEQGIFREVAHSASGKYFAVTLDDAISWGEMMYKGSYKIVC